MSVLKQRVIQVSVSDKFSELQKSGKTPVCLFPNLKAKILHRNSSEVRRDILLYI